MAEFTPKQLDALEDALEDLEIDGDLDDLELDPELAARLAEYRQVLALTRDAFPLDEVPEGLLDGVLAEAREVARSTPAPTPEPRESWTRTWERWRSTLIPIASLAAAAAVVLWIAKPASEQELALVDPEPALHETTAKQPGDTAPLEADSAEPAAGASEMMPVEPPGQPTPAVEERVDATKPALKTKTTTSKAAGAGGGAAAKPVPMPEPAPSVEPLDKDDAWRELDRADAARRKGECERARKIYDDILAASSITSVVGRAKAGIGLCLEQDGKKSQAETWFEQARASNPSVDAWIRSQRDEQPMPGEKKNKSKAEAYEPMHDAL